jgi:hypothetical protein
MVEIKVDNDDGTKNWDNRAFVAVFAERLIGGTKKTLLSKVKGNPEFAKLVAKEWDVQMRRSRARRKREKKS